MGALFSKIFSSRLLVHSEIYFLTSLSLRLIWKIYFDQEKEKYILKWKILKDYILILLFEGTSRNSMGRILSVWIQFCVCSK